MGRPIDLVVGKIEELAIDRDAGWQAFYKKDYENEELREEITKLKSEIRRLKSGSKKSR